MLSNSMFTHLLVEDGAAADAGALEQFFTIHDNTKYVVAMAIFRMVGLSKKIVTCLLHEFINSKFADLSVT